MASDIETVVVGAGVVGLAIAERLAEAGHEVVVVEQHDRIGSETSSRNSEVIHAGLYYPPSSLKSRLCIDGKARLYRFAAEAGIEVRRRGKLLVATSTAEIAVLEAIATNARVAGVDDLVRLSPSEIRKLEPEIACVAAYLSPSTGVIDSHGFVLALAGKLEACGGSIVLRHRALCLAAEAGGFTVTVGGPGGEVIRLTCRNLVMAAGLHSSALARTLFGSGHGYVPPVTYFAKGHYFEVTGAVPFTHLVYPVPSAGGLGVHLTLDVAGRAKLGPDVAWTSEIDYRFDDGDGGRRRAFAAAARRWWPQLQDDRLRSGYTGVRAKLVTAGQSDADFAIHGSRQHGHARLVMLYGIESPGLTAALAIANHVAAQLEKTSTD